ncbi:NADH-ubiquinone oxidoreductase B12 subunit family-domain-containing protein [Staphylotrichum tortipilum]|uniref:NADH-ubiquinone oxidoreductase B12 subunit family-domain-containing protein n=1 Tax=Staphylotrichum tortipilum TaxID=2831512 RepID=A0AAN6RTL9_9PEZI|nr:NADH-ubiquinone oxidoreductase B12 subunit family-domain-containing protein [Staphylotrichum longicolle]
MRATRALLLFGREAQKPNITGFDIRHLRAATGKPRYDPWERAEAWRYTGRFSRWNRFRDALPGLGTAIVAFSAYCTYEHFFLTDDSHGHGHGEGHGEGKEHH